jgi:hypothetical protein
LHPMPIAVSLPAPTSETHRWGFHIHHHRQQQQLPPH